MNLGVKQLQDDLFSIDIDEKAEQQTANVKLTRIEMELLHDLIGRAINPPCPHLSIATKGGPMPVWKCSVCGKVADEVGKFE